LKMEVYFKMSNRPMYRKMYYHRQYKCGYPYVTFGYFESEHVLLMKIMYWNGRTREWKYWISDNDSINNMVVDLEPLPIFNIGWYGREEHQGEFNHGDHY